MTLPTSGYTFDRIEYNFDVEFGGFMPLVFTVVLPNQLGSGSTIETVSGIVESALSGLVDSLSGISTGTPSINKAIYGMIDDGDLLASP